MHSAQSHQGPAECAVARARLNFTEGRRVPHGTGLDPSRSSLVGQKKRW